MIDLTEALIAIKADVRVSIVNNDINQITWHDSNPTNITNDEILAKQAELQVEYDALAYARARETAYPNWQEFAEAYTEKEIGEDSTKWDAYVTKYNLVRSNNPKP